jgi:putative ABC transport system substrate-binding protein
MRRRGLLLACCLAAFAPLAATAVVAQTPAPLPRVAVLAAGRADDVFATPAREAFETGMRERGWKPGLTVAIDYRYAEGSATRLQDLADELVASKVDVIVARGPQPAHAAHRATKAIPIVMSAVPDSVGRGLVASLARPGGNVTGLELLAPELEVKQLELLRDVRPGLRHVAVLSAPHHRGEAPAHQRKFLDAARSMRLQLSPFEVRAASDVTEAFRMMVRNRVEALLVRADPGLIDLQRHEIAELTEKHRLPAVYLLRIFVDAGGLMSYGPDLRDLHRRSAAYVDRLLKGAAPAELPVEQPTKFDFIVNLKAARAIGLTLPHRVLLQATEMIE